MFVILTMLTESLDLVGGLQFNGEFNGPVNTVSVRLSQSVHLTTLFLGRLSPLSG